MLTGWFALVKEGSYVTSLPLHGTHGIYILFDKTHGIYILNTGEFRLSAGYGRSKIDADNRNLALDARVHVLTT